MLILKVRWADGPSVVLLEITPTEGAPSLRLLQGREPRTYVHAIEI
jgi:hypothetical protein